MSNEEMDEMTYGMNKPHDEIKSVGARQQKDNSHYLNDARYSIIGNADEQWSFVYGIRQISRERFNEADFEPALYEGKGFCIYNKESNGASIVFKGQIIALTAMDIGFILGYRLALAKNIKTVSDTMYGCAKKVLSPACFNEFFLMVDWKKVNFYTLFGVVNDKVDI